MANRRLVGGAIAICTGLVSALLAGGLTADEREPDLLAFDNPSGQVRTLNLNGATDFDNPFFQDLGSNGRRCVTCHQPDSGWSITPDNVEARFVSSGGTDPIFTSNDGSNCEGVRPESVDDKREAYSVLLSHGLIRVGLNVPPGAEFMIERVADPNNCAPSSTDASLYRRPLPSTNLRFLSAVMWDGRESSATTTIEQDLKHQANDATRGHAQAAFDLTDAQVQNIVGFELGLFTAQARDREAGNLRSKGADGGPQPLATQPFFLGINDPVGFNPSGAPFDPGVFSLFTAWARVRDEAPDPYTSARQAIARGQAIFNTRPITLSGVAGLNGQTFSTGVTLPASFQGTCTTCHDSPNVGNHSVKAPLNIGLSEPEIAPYLPVYTLRKLNAPDTIDTTDPGRAMITGKWADIGKFKGPILRALASRAPYFHNGSALTLEAVVAFYDRRFNLGLTPQEKADLVAFLRAL